MFNPSSFAMALFAVVAFALAGLALAQANGTYDPGFDPVPLAIATGALSIVSLLFARRVR